VSSLTIVALTTMYKTKIMSKLVAAYTEELLKMLVEEEYKKLSPDLQIQAQNELSHWYQKWFHLVPDPQTSSVDHDEYETVYPGPPPPVDYDPNYDYRSYWSFLTKLVERPMSNKY